MKFLKFIISIISTVMTPLAWGEPNEKVYDEMPADDGFKGDKLAETWGTIYNPNGRTPQTPEKDDTGKPITIARSDDNYGKKDEKEVKPENGETKSKTEEQPSSSQQNLDKVKEIQADESFNKDKAVEALKDYADDDVVIIDGRTTTKKQYLETFESAASPNTDDKTIELGTKKLTEEEYLQLIAEAAKKFGWDENYAKNADEKVLKQTLTDYLNIKEGSLSLNDRNQQVAKQRRELEQKALELDELYTDIENEQKRLEDLKKAKQAILEQDELSIADDVERTKLISRKAAAEEKLKEIDEDLEKNNKRLKAVNDNHAQNWYKTTHLEVLENIPQLVLDKPCWQVIDEMKKMEKERELTQAEIDKLTIAETEWDMLNDFAKYLVENPESKATIKTHFLKNRNKYLSRLPQAAAQSDNSQQQNDKNKDNAFRNKVISIVTKQKHATPGGNGSSSTPSKYDYREDGELERDRAAMIKKTTKVDPSAYNI